MLSSRGHRYKKEAVANFESMSKAETAEGGFYSHSSKNRFDASQDVLGLAGILIKIKTKAQSGEVPLENHFFPNYFTPYQLQMACTDSHFLYTGFASSRK